MEAIYYVTHPNIGKSAIVYAPSTEKARTTYLDWLERNHIIRRADRQYYRQNMVAERMEDPNVAADVELYYGYKSSPYITRFEPERAPEPIKVEEPQSEPEVPEPEVSEPQPVEPPRPRGMPIQQVMLRGYLG